MKLAMCLPYALGALLALNVFAQTSPAAPGAPSRSSAKPVSETGDKSKDKDKDKAKEGKESKEGKKEGKDKDGKDKEGKVESAQEGVKLVAPKGDTLKLKNGKVLEGVKIVRITPREYQVEVSSGAIPINIPHNQVESVVRGPQPNQQGGFVADPSGNIIAGQKLSPDLDKKLSTTDLSHPPLQYKDTDLVKILEELGKKAGVKIAVEQPVKDLDPKSRAWTYTAKEGTTLQTLLSVDLPAQFKNLVVQYQEDTIVVTTKDAVAKPPAAPKDAAAAPAGDGGNTAKAPAKPAEPAKK